MPFKGLYGLEECKMAVQCFSNRSDESAYGRSQRDSDFPRVLQESARQFSEIIFVPKRCLDWALAWSKLDPRQLSRAGGDERHRRDMQETCIALAIRSICLLSKEPSSPVLIPFLRVCSAVRLFFRGDQESLGGLYDQMVPVDESAELHPFQIPPTPIFGHWPEGHCLSWGQFFSIARGIMGDTPLSFAEDTGIAEYVTPPERIARKDWKGLFHSLGKMALHWSGMQQESSFAPECLLKVSDMESSSLVELENPSTVVNLIRAGFHPFAVLDTSRNVEWQEGARSLHYIFYVHLACSWGRSEVLRALLEQDKEGFRRYYAKIDEQDENTPYRRAVMNQKYPSVLIPLIQEAEEDPQGHLAVEIRKWANRAEKPQCVPLGVAELLSGMQWRNHPGNYLMLACQSGDLSWAQYLVEREEKRAIEMYLSCHAEATKEQRLLAAFDAASLFVNRRSVCGGPSGTPLEVAIRSGHAHVAQFLCDKGAASSLELRFEAMGRTIGRNERMVDLWSEIQHQIGPEIERMPVKATQEQIQEIVAIIMACCKYYEKESTISQSISEAIDASDQTIARIELLLDLKEKNYRPIVEYYYETRHLLASHPLASSSLRSDVRT